MIKFFRHIRKSLLEQNKMGKYFKYAVGEIILVVVGILIALQINNWNENRKIKNEERALLINVLESLERDSIGIVKLSNTRDTVLQLHKDLMDVVNSKKNPNEIKSLNFLRRSLPKRLITKQNHPDLSNQVFDKDVKSAVLTYFETINFFEYVMNNYNELIEDKMRPYLGEKKLLNYGNQFEEKEYINHSLFFKELQNIETQQVLFEAGIKVGTMNIFHQNVKKTNELLKKSIQSYLKKS